MNRISEVRVTKNVRKFYTGLSDEQRIALAAGLEKIRVIEGSRSKNTGTPDERYGGWWFQRMPTSGIAKTLRLLKRHPDTGSIQQVINVWQDNRKQETEE